MEENSANLKNLTFDQLTACIISLGEQKYRGKQIIKWVYQKRVNSFEQMNNMPLTMREKLSEFYTVEKLQPVFINESANGDAVKFGFALNGSDFLVESVLLRDRDRKTACISSQLGCGLGCVFCETGKMGFVRNLSQEEIIGQLIGINDYLESKGDKPVTNIVFMGMGEALSNFDNFLSSLHIIMDEEAFNIGGRRITVSTAGVVPSIEKLMAEDLNVGLAISLNAFNNELRSKLMPVNRKYPIESLIAVAKSYFQKTGRRVTFEYVVIDGETNTPQAVSALHKLLGGLTCKINLIPVNQSKTAQISSPSDSTLLQFSNELQNLGLTVMVRKSRGQDIWGACGQLAGKRIKE